MSGTDWREEVKDGYNYSNIRQATAAAQESNNEALNWSDQWKRKTRL